MEAGDEARVKMMAALAVVSAAARVVACQADLGRSMTLWRRIRRQRRHWLRTRYDDDFLLAFFIFSIKKQRVTRTRRCWMFPRMRHQRFLKEVMAGWENDRWIENFRMTKASFYKLCSIVEHKLQPSPAAVRKPLPLEVRVAVALFSLGSAMGNNVTANQFHCHKSTVRKHVMKFCEAVVDSMVDYIRMPDAEEAKLIAQRWEAKWAFPQAYGVIDGTHIPIKVPEDGYRDHLNQNGWASVQLQAVCDDKYLFRNVYCGGMGSWHDADVLQTSSLFQTSDHLPKEPVLLEGVEVNLCLLGDSAYPLSSWLMKPYPEPLGFTQAVQSAEQQERVSAEESFNVRLSSSLKVMEDAFGRLKGRWRKLQKRMEVDVRFVPLIVTTCCILHNFCELQSERFYDAWLPAPEEQQACFPQPAVRAHAADSAGSARDMRDAICQHLARNYPLCRSIVP